MPLQQISTGADPAAFVRPAKLHVFLADCSGSMHGNMPALRGDVIRRIRNIPQGDALLFNIFSGEGWNRWIIARALSGPVEYDKCESILTEELYARATTCFSEPLADVPAQVVPFLAKYPVVSLIFFSDGIPVVRSLQAEEKAIEAAARAISPLISNGAVVALGDYSDRKRLSKLAQSLGVEFISTDDVQQIGETFEKVTKTRAARRKKVKIPAQTDFAFALSPDGNVTPLDITQSEVLVDEFAAAYTGTALHMGPTDTRPVLFPTDVQYAAALSLVNEGRIDDALQFLSVIGDVAMVRALGNALTNAEIARAEQQIREAVSDPAKRFLGGCSPGCLPAEDAFDLLDLLGLLMNDPECKFYPRHKDFRYKRIGRGETAQAGYPGFKADDNVAVPLMHLTGHSEELNLSVLVKIPGTIELPKEINIDRQHLDRDVLNLPAVFSTFVWRNYSLVSNALLNVTRLPLRFGPDTFAALMTRGILPTIGYDDSVLALDLTQLPTCNRRRGKEATDWQRLANLGLESLRLGSILKVLRAQRTELDPEREADEPVNYTNDQRTFLDACGIDRHGAYAPPTIKADATDVLDIRVLEVKVDRGSAVSMKDFREMLANDEAGNRGEKPKGKKLNFVGSLMKIGHDLILSAMPTKNKNAALTWLLTTIEHFEQQKRALDAEMNARRFAIALTGAWAKSFKEDETTILAGTRKDHPVTLRFKTKQKAI